MNSSLVYFKDIEHHSNKNHGNSLSEEEPICYVVWTKGQLYSFEVPIKEATLCQSFLITAVSSARRPQRLGSRQLDRINVQISTEKYVSKIFKSLSGMEKIKLLRQNKYAAALICLCDAASKVMGPFLT